jgi:hypothetical protein
VKSSEAKAAHREPNTDAEGRPFSHEVIEAVWQKARTMGIYETLRVDAWGWTIVRQDYGNTRSRYGWEIDHIIPLALGGTDDLTNLQPLQWENNRRKDEIHGITQAVPITKSHSKSQRIATPSQGQTHKKKHA